MTINSRLIGEAAQAWKYLNGFICVYKPVGTTIKTMNGIIKQKICDDLNSMKTREPESFVKIERIEAGHDGYNSKAIQDGNSSLIPQVSNNKSATTPVTHGSPQVLHTIQDTPKTQIQVIKTINYADHPLITGPRHQPQDIKIANVNKLGRDISGLALVGLNGSARDARKLYYHRWLRSFIISAEFGKSTEDGFYTSIVVEKTTYDRITKDILEKILLRIQAAHQTLVYRTIGVPMTSQLAYELGSRGIVRPSEESDPIIYSLKCIKFESPYFEFEVQTINETEEFLKALAGRIGLKCHSTAMTTKIRCTKYGPFNVNDHSLLMKHWGVESFINNMQLTKDVLKELDMNLRDANIGRNPEYEESQVDEFNRRNY